LLRLVCDTVRAPGAEKGELFTLEKLPFPAARFPGLPRVSLLRASAEIRA
jgi:hypothetical protein